MKKFSVPFIFSGNSVPFTIYIGLPRSDAHPFQHQAAWVSKEKGGAVNQEVWESFAKLHDLAEQNNVSFEDLCVYALRTSEENNEKSE